MGWEVVIHGIDSNLDEMESTYSTHATEAEAQADALDLYRGVRDSMAPIIVQVREFEDPD